MEYKCKTDYFNKIVLTNDDTEYTLEGTFLLNEVTDYTNAEYDYLGYRFNPINCREYSVTLSTSGDVKKTVRKLLPTAPGTVLTNGIELWMLDNRGKWREGSTSYIVSPEDVESLFTSGAIWVLQDDED